MMQVNDAVIYQGLLRPFVGRRGVLVKIEAAEPGDVIRPAYDLHDFTVAFEIDGGIRDLKSRSGMFDPAPERKR